MICSLSEWLLISRKFYSGTDIELSRLQSEVKVKEKVIHSLML